MQKLPHFSPIAVAYSAELEKESFQDNTFFHSGIDALKSNGFTLARTCFGQAFDQAKDENNIASQVLAVAGYIESVRQEPIEDISDGTNQQVAMYQDKVEPLLEDKSLSPIVKVIYYLESGMFLDESGQKEKAKTTLEKASLLVREVDFTALPFEAEKSIRLAKGIVHMTLGTLAAKQNKEYDFATFKHFEDAIAQFAIVGNNEGLIFCMLNKGILGLKFNQTQQALDDLKYVQSFALINPSSPFQNYAELAKQAFNDYQASQVQTVPVSSNS